jgi:ATPase subunit of ABC transporter with duplicated ATPase domains
LRFAGCSSPSQICCCSTSRRITSTRRASSGSSSTCSAFRARSSRSRTTATFLDNAAGWILELDRGYGIPWEGNYSSWLEQKEKRLEVEQSQEVARIKSMKSELEWVRQNPKGRQSKSKARLARFEELSSQEHQERNETQEIFIPVAERLGKDVIEFTGVSKGYGERLLIDKLSFKVPPGAIVGIIGPNGAGKSTLFRMITGKEKPDSGQDRHRQERQARARRPVARLRSSRRRPCSRTSAAART